ncbi:YtxH domain-containing protein [Pontibacter vulgaris]|uniref:YtxH domain-containing protein n=1 Tax=Pontibacter vulgaris TaxID=2905679 RepID=UPI001FA718F8|nr:YtxH domain-containing protein [Pontibacter vulgaris]
METNTGQGYRKESGSTYSSVGQVTQGRKAVGDSGAGKVAIGLLAGAGVGVLAGILLAPDKGRITRRRVADSAAWVGRGITDVVTSGKEKVGSWTGINKSGRSEEGTYKNRPNAADKSMMADMDDDEQQW